MTNLEHYLKTNRHEVAHFGLPPGMEERFAETLFAGRRSAQQPLRVQRAHWWSAAAAACILVLLAFSAGRYNQRTLRAQAETSIPLASLAEVNPELAEVERFYNYKINLEVERLKQASAQSGTNLGDLFDTLEQLDREYEALRRLLANNFGDNRIINAMILNYQTRLELLDRIKKINDQQNLKNYDVRTAQPAV